MRKELTALAPLTRDLTEDLMKVLTQQGYSFTATAEREILRVVKEILCDTRLDYDTELKSTAEFDKDKTYLLPDRIIVTVFAERFLLRESVVAESTTLLSMKCGVDIRKGVDIHFFNRCGPRRTGSMNLALQKCFWTFAVRRGPVSQHDEQVQRTPSSMRFFFL